MKIKGFTLIELLVVVAIVGVVTAIGVKAYNGYIKSAQKKTVELNFRNTVKYMEAEIAKCKLDRNAKAFGLPCPVRANSVLSRMCSSLSVLEISNQKSITNRKWWSW